MMRKLMIVALLARTVLLSMEKHQAKAGPQRVEVLRMVTTSQAVAKVTVRTLGLRKVAPRNKAGSRLQVTPRKARRPKAAHLKVDKVACRANLPRVLVA